jgi:hypothetical protein
MASSSSSVVAPRVAGAALGFGARSARAKSTLEAAGYTKVEDLGAMSRW